MIFDSKDFPCSPRRIPLHSYTLSKETSGPTFSAISHE
jgi:hypothetical protein